MAYFKITQNTKGLQAKIQVSSKDIKTGKNKLFTKRVYNDDGLSDAKFRKYVEKCSIEFEEEVARAYREGTAAVTARVLTFTELMKEWKQHITAELSVNYYNIAVDVEKKFTAYLIENKLADKPITAITIRDIQVFLNTMLQRTHGKIKAALIKDLPKCVNFSELARSKIMSNNMAYRLKKKNGAIMRTAADKVCERYGLIFSEYFREIREEKPYAYSTVREYRQVLRTVFNEALRYEWLTKNPVIFTKINVNIGKQYKVVTEKEIFSLSESKVFLNCLKTLPINKRMPFEIMLLTGLRRAEMCGLRWADIDLDNKVLHVVRNRAYSASCGVYEKPPKTRASIRDVPLIDSLIADLKEYMDWFRQADPKFDNKLNEYYLAANDERQPIHPCSLRPTLKGIEEKNKLKNVTCHGLRHTYCSLLLSQGVPIQTVSKYMGHSDSTVTLKVYSHFVPDTQGKFITALNNIVE